MRSVVYGLCEGTFCTGGEQHVKALIYTPVGVGSGLTISDSDKWLRLSLPRQLSLDSLNFS